MDTAQWSTHRVIAGRGSSVNGPRCTSKRVSILAFHEEATMRLSALMSVALLAACALAVASDTSFYEVLGIEKSATEKEIKKAYRKQVGGLAGIPLGSPVHARNCAQVHSIDTHGNPLFRLSSSTRTKTRSLTRRSASLR